MPQPINVLSNNNQGSEADHKIARLTAKLSKIRSDILFDEEEANSRWTETWTRLANETAERKRLGIRNGNEPIHNGNEREYHTLEKPLLGSNNVTEPIDNSQDTSDLLGELFSMPSRLRD